MICVEHGPPSYSTYLQTTSEGLLRLGSRYGKEVHQFLEVLLSQKSVDGLRPARGVLSLASRYPLPELQAACQRCLEAGEVSYRTLKHLLENTASPQPPSFLFARPLGYFDPNPQEVSHG
jgi:hypothetical protein